MSVPSRADAFTKLLHHINEAQSQAAVLMHLHNTEDAAKDKLMAMGWLAVSEQLKRFAHAVTKLATGRMH